MASPHFLRKYANLLAGVPRSMRSAMLEHDLLIGEISVCSYVCHAVVLTQN